MHECRTSGQVCDCDGDDTWQPQPADHLCLNPDCDSYDDALDDVEDEA